jgi:hypothetical protein
MREAGEPGWGDASPDILQDLFMNYVPSDLEVAGATKEALRRLFDPAAGDIESRFAGIREAWEATQFTGYGEAVRLIAREVYGLDSLTAEGLEVAQRKLEELRRPGERFRRCGRSPVLITHDDFQWRKPDEPGPDFFLYDLHGRASPMATSRSRASSRKPHRHFKLEDTRHWLRSSSWRPARLPSRRRMHIRAPYAEERPIMTRHGHLPCSGRRRRGGDPADIGRLVLGAVSNLPWRTTCPSSPHGPSRGHGYMPVDGAGETSVRYSLGTPRLGLC